MEDGEYNNNKKQAFKCPQMTAVIYTFLRTPKILKSCKKRLNVRVFTTTNWHLNKSWNVLSNKETQRTFNA